MKQDIQSFTLRGAWSGNYSKKVGFEGNNFTRIGSWGSRNVYYVNSARASPGMCIFTMD